jgi:hypothetical protein
MLPLSSRYNLFDHSHDYILHRFREVLFLTRYFILFSINKLYSPLTTQDFQIFRNRIPGKRRFGDDAKFTGFLSS